MSVNPAHTVIVLVDDDVALLELLAGLIRGPGRLVDTLSGGEGLTPELIALSQPRLVLINPRTGGLGPQQMFELGKQLAALRDDGVLVLASGGAVHNLGRLDWNGGDQPAAWAANFESWVRDRLRAGDVDALLDYRSKAPDLKLAHPSDDHFVPLLVALGAGVGAGPVTFPIEGWELGSLSRLAVRFG